MKPHLQPVAIALLLVIATSACYLQVYGHDFLNYDDPYYVTDVEIIRQGLSWRGVRWAFTAFHAGNWHPLTWLSHMLDATLFGVETAGPHHLMNLLFHLINTVLLFFLLRTMTGTLWPGALTAALFALHPLHVESVAWVSERKDLLSTLCLLGTMGAYCRYVRQPRLHNYFLVILLFGLGLLAKPMLVTLPFVLLLLDFWPFGRWACLAGAGGAGNPGTLRDWPALHRRWMILLEKAPLLALSAASCVVTVMAQREGGAVSSLTAIPLALRTANAVWAYCAYLGKMFWPSDLSILYPLATSVAWGRVTAGALLLAAVSVWVTIGARRRPHWFVGWAWYLGTLVPVIGLVQVGLQSMADRYTYIPSIGIFVAISWSAAAWEQRAAWRRPLVLATMIALAALGIRSWYQLHHWRDSKTLFEHTLSITGNNSVAHEMLGNAYLTEGRVEEAIFQLKAALAGRPDLAAAHLRLGEAFARQERTGEALAHYHEARRLKPEWAIVHNNLGNLYAGMGKLEEAVAFYRETLEREPSHVKAHFNLGMTLGLMGRYGESARHLEAAAGLDPRNAGIRLRLSQTYYLLGDTRSAAREGNRLKQLNPRMEEELGRWLEKVRK